VGLLQRTRRAAAAIHVHGVVHNHGEIITWD
jgi:hypothetical protein